MKNQLLLFLVIINTSLFAQIGAKVQQQSQNKLTGIWQNSSQGFQMVLMLNEDRSGEFDGEAIHYAVVGSKLSIEASGVKTVYDFVLQINSLTLSGGDLQASLMFTRAGSIPSAQAAPSQSVKTKTEPTSNAKLLGLWSGNGESIEFTKEGKCNYLGQTYPYEQSNEHVTLQTAQGNVMMAYVVANNQLTLTVNGKQLVYSKGTQGAISVSKGNVAQELVGKWCYVNVYSTSTGGSSSSSCFVLNGDGTYEYSGESSRSVNTSDLYGGTSSQSEDRGTWWVQGDRIHYNSQSRGPGSYQLQKQNHPKNGDPMIVIDGQSYVTFYNKAPWR